MLSVTYACGCRLTASRGIVAGVAKGTITLVPCIGTKHQGGYAWLAREYAAGRFETKSIDDRPPTKPNPRRFAQERSGYDD